MTTTITLPNPAPAIAQETLNDALRWQAVINRDANYNGQFFFAVRTTGIYCKPSCAARQPKRNNVEFFMTCAAAEEAGYRPCKRCHPRSSVAPEPHVPLIEAICQAIAESETPIPLLDLAQRFHLSPFHLQRTFKRIVGVSPKQYGDALRAERFKQQLHNGQSVTTAIYEAGFGSSSTLYDNGNHKLGMTPTNYRRKGQNQTIVFTIAPCALGFLLVAATEHGLCAIRLGDNEAELETTLRAEFAAATIQRDDYWLQTWVHALLEHLQGTQPHLDLPLDVQATAFQRRVWDALRQIPYGGTRSYSEVARMIDQPTAVRAVARACASNSVALVIPCHRVVRDDGSLGGYRWGMERKEKLLAKEKEQARI